MKKNFAVFSGLLSVLMVTAVARVSAQPGTRRSPSDSRREIANDVWRELMKNERETPITPIDNSERARALRLKQIQDDFKSIQDVKNQMMAQAWSGGVLNHL